jgi:hypothetical protein
MHRRGGGRRRGQALDHRLCLLPQCLVLLAQHLLALLHLPQVAQFLHEMVDAFVEPRVVTQQAAQLDLLELDH